MGRRPRFAPDQCEWINDQLLRSREVKRSRQVWQSQYAAFLARFPDAHDKQGEPITFARYRAHVQRVERDQESQPISRVVAHLRRHELLEMDGQTGTLSEPVVYNDLMEDDDEEDEVEMRVVIKSEHVPPTQNAEVEDQDDCVVVPRVKAPLLRTRATAVQAERKQDQVDQTTGTAAPPLTPALTAKRPRGRPKKATTMVKDVLLTDTPRKRAKTPVPIPPAVTPTSSTPTVNQSVTPRVDDEHTSRTEQTHQSLQPLSDMVPENIALERAKRETKQWKKKYEAEKAVNDRLQARLSEALASLEAQKQQLQRLESASVAGSTPIVASTNTTNQPLTFMFSVNVDVMQNGQRLITTSHALQIGAEVRPAV